MISQQIRQLINEGRELSGLRTPKKKSEKRGIRTWLPNLWERVQATVMPVLVKSGDSAAESPEASTSADQSEGQNSSHPPSQSQDMGAPEVVMNNDMERPERHSTLTPGLLGLAVGSQSAAADSQPGQQNANAATTSIDQRLDNPPPTAANSSKTSRVDALGTVDEMIDQGYKIVENSGGGDCLFYSAAYLIYGDDRWHETVRAEMIKYMKENRAFFEPHIDYEEISGIAGKGVPMRSFDDYLQWMGSRYTYGDELEVQALSDMYYCPIEIVTNRRDYSHRRVPNFIDETRQLGPPLRFVYTSANEHYRAMVHDNEFEGGVFEGRLGTPNEDSAAVANEVMMETTAQEAQDSDTESGKWWKNFDPSKVGQAHRASAKNVTSGGESSRMITGSAKQEVKEKALSSSKASKIQLKKLFSGGDRSDDLEETTTAPVAKKRKGEEKAGGEASSSKQKSNEVPKIMPRSGSSEDEEESDNDVANLDDLEYDLLELDPANEEEEEEDNEENLDDGIDAPDDELKQMAKNAAKDQDEDWSKLCRLIESARNAHRQRDPDYRSDITITTGNAYLNIPTKMKDGTIVKYKDYSKIKEKEDTINYALRLSGPAFAKYIATLMLERRAAVNAVVAKIRKERADSGGEVWNTHTDIDKFLSEVNSRADLKEMLKSGGATANDMRLRLEYLRRLNESSMKIRRRKRDIRPVIDEVVETIRQEQISSGGEVWSKHYDIDKFISEVNGREDLKQLLGAEGVTLKDLRSRLGHLRRLNEVIKITKLRNGFLM
ncbi:hypothetical protein WR25_05940 [Diploscapter pachys]|uniref:OTU domain-containing protein n=1 Tax=Diploscapter pachys TaxID=2018661 RepID=A0A2A2L5U3_9BILA|nr:hypothetical protein WR25_05940 [Diploscapter pachys]